MDKHYSVCEIIELGIEIEKNGKDFYSVLAAKADNPEAKSTFKYLSDAEEKHIEVFQGILKKACKYEPEGAYPDEYFAYMNALAGQHVFTQEGRGKAIAGAVKTSVEGLDMGIQFEKDSILFYEGMKRIIAGKDRTAIEELIKEEKNHLNKLKEIKEETHP